MKLNKISFFKLKVTFVLTIFMAISSVLSAQSQQYFYEFVVPSLSSEVEKENVTRLLNEIDLYDVRVDHFSGKVLCFSSEKKSAADFTQKFNENSYFIYFFHVGVQGNDEHYSRTIEEWNRYNLNEYSSKVFIAISQKSFSEDQKKALSDVVKLNLSIQKIEFSNNNKKVILQTDKVISRDEVKKLFYDYKLPNKLENLVEIFK